MENIIEARNLIKEYELNKEHIIRVINDVNLEIQKGEFVSILGRSGSGKSTLLNMFGGLIAPTRGEILVNGKGLSKLNDKERAAFRNKQIGFVFQSFYVEKRFSAYDNVLFPLLVTKLPMREMRERVEYAMDTVGLADRMSHRPVELSGGEIQRLCIARAIVNDPSILFADEPTGQLDSSTGAKIMELFQKLNTNGKTIVMVTHNEADAQVYSKRIIKIQDGKITDEVS